MSVHSLSLSQSRYRVHPNGYSSFQRLCDRHGSHPSNDTSAKAVVEMWETAKRTCWAVRDRMTGKAGIHGYLQRAASLR